MKNIKKIAQILIYLLVLYFIAKIIYNNWNEMGNTIENINYGWLLLSLIIITIALTFQSYIWHHLLKNIQSGLHFRKSFITYFKSIITRYLPGGIWVFFARTYITEKLGFSKAQILFLMVMESILAVLSGSLVFLFVRPASPYTTLIIILAVLLIITAVLIILLPSTFIKFIKKITGKQIELIPLNFPTFVRVTLLYLIQWLIVGLGIWLLINSLMTFHINNLPEISSIFAISWVFGFIVLVTPSGLGIRESILTILLSGVVNIEIAVLVSLLSRILFTIGELINFIFSLIIKMPKSKKTPHPISTHQLE